MRVGDVVTWYPRHVKLSVYNENSGKREEIILEKRSVAIIENPLYAVMNEPNSTLQRLIRKLAMLDAVDEQSSSGRLDIIIQLPYVIKSEARRQQAETRREDIEFQLKGSQYGIAYIDGTEKVTQLNRPSENNLLKQVEYLTALLYNQLGLTEEVMNGTAQRIRQCLITLTVLLILFIDAIVEVYANEHFIGPQAKHYNRSKQLEYFRDPFKLVPIAQMSPRLQISLLETKFLPRMKSDNFMGSLHHQIPKQINLINSNMPQAGNCAPNGVSPKVELIQLTLERNGQNGTRFQRIRN
jgi:hypothetical protein